MAVYVDNAQIPYRGMKMCHMVADTKEELIEMIKKIGVNEKYIQKENTVYEHFDICMSKRNKAIKNGAKKMTSRQLVIKIREKREKLQGYTGTL